MKKIINIFLLLLFTLSATGQAYSKSYKKKCCGCCVEEEEEECNVQNAAYTYYNVGGANAASLFSCEDDNDVWLLNNAGIPTQIANDLDKQEGIEFNLVSFNVIKSCKPIVIGGEEGNAGLGIYSDRYKGTTIGTNASRYGGIDLNIYSLGATSADIFRNGILQTTISLIPNTGTIYTQTGNYTGTWSVVANGFVLGYRREDLQGNGDPTPMMPQSSEIVGWASTAAYIGSTNSVSIPFTTQSHEGTYSSNTNVAYNIVNSVDLPHTTAQSRYYDKLVALYTNTFSGNLFATSRADGDGGTNTAHVPVNLITCNSHVIPQPTEYISFMNAGGSPVMVYDQFGNLLQTWTMTRNNPNAWYSGRTGNINGLQNYAAGTRIESAEPIHVVYQTKGAGSYGSNDDEVISEGCCN